MILHTDAKKLYKLTNEDIDNSIMYEYNFRAHSQICSKYFVNEIEDAAIEKYEKLDGIKNIKILDKILEMKNKRVEYISRYVSIRNELKILIDKIHDNNNYNYDYNLDEPIQQMISTLASTSEDIYACTTTIYNHFSKKIIKSIQAEKRIKLVKKLFFEGLGAEWYQLVDTTTYDQLIDINFCEEDKVIDNVNKEINNQQKIKIRTKSLNELLREKLIIHLPEDNFEKYLNHIIKTHDYYYLNDVKQCNWEDVLEWMNNADNVNIFQTIINRIEKEKQIENYIKTSVNKTYQKYILNKGVVYEYVTNTKTFEQIQVMIQNLINKRKRKLSVKRYVDKKMMIFNMSDSFINTSLKSNEIIQEFIVGGGKISKIKGVIHNIISKHVKAKQISMYINMKEIYEETAKIYNNQTIIDFINAECDINQKDLLSDDIKQVINKLCAPLIRKQQLDDYIKNRNVYNIRYKIYNNEIVKNFLDVECDVNVQDYMHDAIEVKRVIDKAAKKKALDEYIKYFSASMKDAIYDDQNVIDFLNDQSIHLKDYLPKNIKIIINNIKVPNKITQPKTVTVQPYNVDNADNADFEGNIMIKRDRRVNIRKILTNCDKKWIKYNQNALYTNTRIRNFIDNYGKSYCDENWNSIKILIHEFININNSKK